MLWTRAVQDIYKQKRTASAVRFLFNFLVDSHYGLALTILVPLLLPSGS